MAAARRPATRRAFDLKNPVRLVIAVSLLRRLVEARRAARGAPARLTALIPMITDLNLAYPGGPATQLPRSRYSQPHLFVRPVAPALEVRAARDNQCTTAANGVLPTAGSLTGTAVRASYVAVGEGIVWSVLDSGIGHSLSTTPSRAWPPAARVGGWWPRSHCCKPRFCTTASRTASTVCTPVFVAGAHRKGRGPALPAGLDAGQPGGRSKLRGYRWHPAGRGRCVRLKARWSASTPICSFRSTPTVTAPK